MKKRTLALLMIGALALSCPVTSFAETEEAEEEYDEEEYEEEEGDEEESDLEFTYDMIDESVYDGTWITCFEVFDLYLPSDWDVLVNVENGETPDNGVYFQAASEDKSRSAAITYASTDGTDLETLGAAYEEQGFEYIQYGIINEIPVVFYEQPSDDGTYVMGFSAIGDQGGVYSVVLGAAEDDDEFFSDYVSNITCSFSAAEVEEEAE